MATYAKLRRLTEPRESSLDETFERLAHSLRNSGKTATVRYTIQDGDEARHWTLCLRRRECSLQRESAEAPDLEIVTGEAAWREIAEGRLSPLEAFAQGRLRVLGDPELGSHLLAVAGDGDGAVAICEG